MSNAAIAVLKSSALMGIAQVCLAASATRIRKMAFLCWLWCVTRRRRDHVPRLWPMALGVLADDGTYEVHYELGEFNTKVGRVCAR